MYIYIHIYKTYTWLHVTQDVTKYFSKKAHLYNYKLSK